jgi:hypothetical protein
MGQRLLLPDVALWESVKVEPGMLTGDVETVGLAAPPSSRRAQ